MGLMKYQIRELKKGFFVLFCFFSLIDICTPELVVLHTLYSIYSYAVLLIPPIPFKKGVCFCFIFLLFFLFYSIQRDPIKRREKRDKRQKKQREIIRPCANPPRSFSPDIFFLPFSLNFTRLVKPYLGIPSSLRACEKVGGQVLVLDIYIF